MINAFNLIDGVDALCGGLSFFIINTVGIIYLVSNVKAVATLCFILSAGKKITQWALPETQAE